MARVIIDELANGNTNIIGCVSNNSLAVEIYQTLKQTDYQLAVKFNELYRYFKITGHLMDC